MNEEPLHFLPFEEPRWVLVVAESIGTLLVLGCLFAAVFLVSWLWEACVSRLAPRQIPIDSRRFPISHEVLSSPTLWASARGALFREVGRAALARDQPPLLELMRRAHVVERVLRGQASWLRLATPAAEVRTWVDVYLDSAAPRLERS